MQINDIRWEIVSMLIVFKVEYDNGIMINEDKVEIKNGRVLLSTI